MPKKNHRAPYEIAKQLGSIRLGLFDSLRDRYHLAYTLGFSSRRGDVVSIKRTGHTDPTGDTIADKEEFRRQVEFAAHKILEACTALDTADAVLDKLTGSAGRYERVRHLAGEQIPLER